jgi:hypothetical protein
MLPDLIVSTLPAMVIPDNMLPAESQVPAYVKTREDRERFHLAFAIGRVICNRDDPQFVRALFFGDLPTGELRDGEVRIG